MYVSASIKEVFFAPGSANFPASLASAFGLGIRSSGKFIGEPHNPLTDMRNRQFPNMMNFRVEADTMQTDLAKIIALITYAKAGASSVAVLTGPLTVGGSGSDGDPVTSANGGIFLFENANALGVGFELNITQAERLLKVNFERAFKYTSPDAIIDAADTESIPFLTSGIPAIDTDKVLSGFISPNDVTGMIPAALTASFADLYLDEFTINLKTKSTKSGFNIDLLSGLQVELSASAIGVDQAALVELFKHEFPSADLVVTLLTGETLTFKKESLTRVGNFDFSDEKRMGKIMYTGEYDPDFITSTVSNINFNTFLQP